MKPDISVVSLLLLLLLDTTTQGIRLDKEYLAAFHNNIHEEESSMGGVSKVAGLAPCGINGHCSGRSRKLMNKTMATVKNRGARRQSLTLHKAIIIPRKPSIAVEKNSMHMEPPVSKQPQTYPDTLDIAGMDYSHAKRKPPIHN